MADNVAITAGTGTAIAADDVSSVFYQKVKLDYGADGATAPVTAVTPLPIIPFTLPANFIKGATAAITDTTRTAVITAQGEGVKIYVTHILVTNGDADTGTLVTIEDGTTALYSGYAAAAGGGFSITLPVPLVGSANTALNATCGTTGATVYVSASGYKGA